MAIFRRKYRTEAAQNTTEREKEERRKAHKHPGKRTNDQIYPELKRAAGENKVRGLKKKKSAGGVSGWILVYEIKHVSGCLAGQRLVTLVWEPNLC